MSRMWMVRSDGGDLYDTFRERGVVAVNWSLNLWAGAAALGLSKEQLREKYLAANPNVKPGRVVAITSQIWRFINELKIGDRVLTYSPQTRMYSIGEITGDAEYHGDEGDNIMALTRKVDWASNEISRDILSKTAKAGLGSIATLFEVQPKIANELLSPRSLSPHMPDNDDFEDDDDVLDPFADVDSEARERIKDRVNALAWDDMQELIAGVLRAMGYKTQVSRNGPDQGKDIVASPDGFGFENPRIVVEVKHRPGEKMGSKDIRSFLGGRHKDDRGLYVSTGGFTQDAKYEADRAAIPLQMWTIDDIVRALVEHYDATDAETKRLIPLKRLYWTA